MINRITSEARKKVARWPKWKRNVHVTQHSTGFKMGYKDTILEDTELTDIAETLYNFRNAMDIKGVKNTLWQLANRQAKETWQILLKEVEK